MTDTLLSEISRKRIQNIFNILNGVPNSSLLWNNFFLFGICFVWIQKLCCVVLHHHFVPDDVLVYLVLIQQQLLLAQSAPVVHLPGQLRVVVPILLHVLPVGHLVEVLRVGPHPCQRDQPGTNMTFVCATIRHVVTVHTRLGGIGAVGLTWGLTCSRQLVFSYSCDLVPVDTRAHLCWNPWCHCGWWYWKHMNPCTTVCVDSIVPL